MQYFRNQKERKPLLQYNYYGNLKNQKPFKVLITVFIKLNSNKCLNCKKVVRESKPLIPFSNIGNRNSKCLDNFRGCYKGQLISDNIFLSPMTNKKLSITVLFRAQISWSNNFWTFFHYYILCIWSQEIYAVRLIDLYQLLFARFHQHLQFCQCIFEWFVSKTTFDIA